MNTVFKGVRKLVTAVGAVVIGVHLGLGGAVFAADRNAEKQAEKQRYGELYFVDENERLNDSYRITTHGGFEFSNPYFNVFSAGLGAHYRLGTFFMMGLEANQYFVSKHEFSDTLANALKTSSTGLLLVKPEQSGYLLLTAVPLSGHLNWLNETALESDVYVTAGPGMVRYSSNEYVVGLLWGLGFDIGITQTIGLNIQIGQEVESIFSDSVYRTYGRGGLSFGF